MKSNQLASFRELAILISSAIVVVGCSTNLSSTDNVPDSMDSLTAEATSTTTSTERSTTSPVVQDISDDQSDDNSADLSVTFRGGPRFLSEDEDDSADPEELPKFSGTRDIQVTNPESGNSYTLEADITDGIVDTIHFPNGGSAEMSSGDVDGNGTGDGIDVHGRSWEFEGYDD